jgi:hypothetical protein
MPQEIAGVTSVPGSNLERCIDPDRVGAEALERVGLRHPVACWPATPRHFIRDDPEPMAERRLVHCMSLPLRALSG